MKMTHLARIVDMDPRIATFENKVVAFLATRGRPMKSGYVALFLKQRCKVTTQEFYAGITRLTDEGVIVRKSTARKNSWVLSLTPWGEQLAEDVHAPEYESEARR